VATDAGIPTGPLVIAPANATVTVPLGQSSAPLVYTASISGVAVSASFAIDLGQVAVINASSGSLTATGTVGGVAHVSASFGGQTVSTPVTVVVTLTDNGGADTQDGGAPGAEDSGAGGVGGVGGSPPGGSVGGPTQTVLTGPTTSDPGLSWLYPYDQTVWPQGLLPPLLQWSAPRNYDAVLLELSETGFRYQGFFSAPSPGQPFVNMPIQAPAWNTLVYSNQGEPVKVTLVFSAAGVAYGPITETWIIAPGPLTGTVYYNSYGTELAINYAGSNNLPAFGGATLAIKHGATSPVLIAGASGDATQCRVCHSVAAGGGTLVTQHGDNYNESSSYALGAGDTETVLSPADARFAFPGLSPDGAYLFGNTGPFPGISPPSTTGLYSLPSGAPLSPVGLPDGGLAAAAPAFSPDGSHVAFNAYGQDKISLASIDFSELTTTFSNLQTLDTPASGTDLFPAYLPTNDAIIFERETANAGEFGATRNGARGELWWVDVGTKMVAPLATLNGTGYLPTGPNNHSDDTTLQYEPTVNPVVSGGYAWVVFTSRRLYGNVATQDPFLSDPRNYDYTQSVTTKKLWVAAIDLNAVPGTDPSHPAFYLPAQELHAGNSRGYWVVDPCEANGSSCLAGDQCCSGYCGAGDAGGLVCGMPPPGCAVLGNKCTVSSDCCGASSGIDCIDGYCAKPAMPPQDAGSCTAATCMSLGLDCGPVGDGCGNLLECGTCTAPETCGGGGTSGVCGTSGGPH
jgi:hypothetical protein